ncbi:MAG: alpha/beta fold hydrolase [Pseudomonadota bacterium]|nr:alpha/beta fold hydrolase [Pseudomonadota bacterium]
MAAASTRTLVDGAAGAIEVSVSLPDAARAVAVIAHPHPLFGGTMDNKVVTTVARAFTDAGMATYRFNFRGVGATAGAHDDGRGEADDMLRVIEHARAAAGAAPLYLAGFSFGGAVATRASERADFAQLVLVAPGFRRIAEHGMGEAPDPHDPNLGSSGRHTGANTVIVHGDLDATVPLADSIAWAAPREVPVVVVPGGEHFFHRKLHVLREIVARWIR